MVVVAFGTFSTGTISSSCWYILVEMEGVVIGLARKEGWLRERSEINASIRAKDSTAAGTKGQKG